MWRLRRSSSAGSHLLPGKFEVLHMHRHVLYTTVKKKKKEEEAEEVEEEEQGGRKQASNGVACAEPQVSKPRFNS